MLVHNIMYISENIYILTASSGFAMKSIVDYQMYSNMYCYYLYVFNARTHNRYRTCPTLQPGTSLSP